jgi:uncharacterized RDD family membrane protein YckC
VLSLVRNPRTRQAQDVALGLAYVCGRAGIAAGRVAVMPLRVAARMPIVASALDRTGTSLAAEGRAARVRALGRLEVVAGQVMSSAEVGRSLDNALAGPLPETVARSVVERHVVQRVVDQILESGDVETAIAAALDRAETERLVQETLSSPGFEKLATRASDSLLASKLPEHVIDSAEMQQLVVEITTTPAVRAALVRSTATLGAEVSAGLRRRTARLDSASERKVQSWLPESARSQRPEPTAHDEYGGLGARGIAFAADLAICTFVFLVGAAVAWLVSSIAGGLGPGWLRGLLAGSGWAIVVGAYLVLFWTVTGQTPGMRFMHLRLTDRRGAPVGVARSLVRLFGLFVAIVPCLAGFLPVLVDGRRRALQDFIAGTVVHADRFPPPLAEPVGENAEVRSALVS